MRRMRTAKHGIWPQMGRTVYCCLLNVLKLTQSVDGVSGYDSPRCNCASHPAFDLGGGVRRVAMIR